MSLSDGFACITFLNLSTRCQRQVTGCLKMVRAETSDLVFSANIDGWELLLFSSTAPASPYSPSSPWWLSHDRSWQTNHQHVILKDTVCVTLLAGASALCFFFSHRCWQKKQSDTVRAESSWISAPDDRSSLCLRATGGIRLEKCEHSSQKLYRQTDRVTADVQKLLSRQFGERTASVCQLVAMRQSWLSECK